MSDENTVPFQPPAVDTVIAIVVRLADGRLVIRRPAELIARPEPPQGSAR